MPTWQMYGEKCILKIYCFESNLLKNCIHRRIITASIWIIKQPVMWMKKWKVGNGKCAEKKQTHSHMCSRFKIIFALTHKMQVQTTCLPYGYVFSNSVIISVSNIANLERNAWWRSLICDSLIYFYIFACYNLFLLFFAVFSSSSSFRFVSFRFFC